MARYVTCIGGPAAGRQYAMDDLARTLRVPEHRPTSLRFDPSASIEKLVTNTHDYRLEQFAGIDVMILEGMTTRDAVNELLTHYVNSEHLQEA